MSNHPEIMNAAYQEFVVLTLIDDTEFVATRVELGSGHKSMPVVAVNGQVESLDTIPKNFLKILLDDEEPNESVVPLIKGIKWYTTKLRPEGIIQ